MEKFSIDQSPSQLQEDDPYIIGRTTGVIDALNRRIQEDAEFLAKVLQFAHHVQAECAKDSVKAQNPRESAVMTGDIGRGKLRALRKAREICDYIDDFIEKHIGGIEESSAVEEHTGPGSHIPLIEAIDECAQRSRILHRQLRAFFPEDKADSSSAIL
ncbi:Phosphoglyceromutase [Perkinsela sp. CCAP 1560/4]|nr:Phosphoglyceromutase [Perkinsela sp. CCAP 1560/4]|eukprot:KNH04044.1 Phosphoglyceromutase [Perkinsela sp. CCAP 1560/4]